MDAGGRGGCCAWWWTEGKGKVTTMAGWSGPGVLAESWVCSVRERAGEGIGSRWWCSDRGMGEHSRGARPAGGGAREQAWGR